jgi:hypothetical protein
MWRSLVSDCTGKPELRLRAFADCVIQVRLFGQNLFAVAVSWEAYDWKSRARGAEG